MNEIIEKDNVIKELTNENFKNIVDTIKNEIKVSQLKVMYSANQELVMLYFKIGEILEDNSKYGNNFIKNVSHAIRLEYPNIKGFSGRNLRSMKFFYKEYKNDKNWQQLVAKLPGGS